MLISWIKEGLLRLARQRLDPALLLVALKLLLVVSGCGLGILLESLAALSFVMRSLKGSRNH
jgi:hypothetical protein